MTFFAARLTALMKERSWSQVEAARCLNVSQALISQYLSGTRTPLPRTIDHIAERLGISPQELTSAKPVKGSLGGVKSHEVQEFDLSEVSGRALRNLQRRWNRKPTERATIRHLIEALFPDDAEAILNWLDRKSP